eukprot:TRINITY_DN64548_c0_g1_i1.p1 TRINITY_DN64548_c0_g1~~TRINITY_DN64548_c0_g1_i1.p1  ORF type:complete len:366 (+),score=65.54 TRINITY_DN64548_c0_g1_i1:79-1176(+)
METYLPERDRLLRYIAKTDFAETVLAQIQESGFIVLPGVFSATEVDMECDRMWNWVEKVSPTVHRRNPSSWARGGNWDPWPCSQRDMMQCHQAGWVFNDLRVKMAERIFEPLYGTHELHSSKDGFTLQRPTSEELNKSPNDHFDQCHLRGLQCIQGSVALTDQEHDDGCFLCWPGSHKYHESRRGKKRGRKDFIILDDNEKDFLAAEGIQPLRVPVKKGDVILFRSDLAHKGALPIGRRDNFRAVVYICMLPAALTPEDAYEAKQQAYLQLETGGHWPCREEWFVPRQTKIDIKPYFKSLPHLTARQRLLYGLDRYEQSAEASPPAQKAAPKRRWRKKRDEATEKPVERESSDTAVSTNNGDNDA